MSVGILRADIVEVDAGLRLDVDLYTPTLGWYGVGLSKVEYVVEPDDKIQDIVVHGTPPDTDFPLTSIQVYSFSLALPEWARGVRVVDSKNEPLMTLRALQQDVEPVGDDAVFLSAAGLQGDKLMLDVRYGGGCRRHDFQLSWDGLVMESAPPQVRFQLSHNANGDPCKGLKEERLQFDLSPELSDAEQYTIHVASDVVELTAHRGR